MRNIVKLLVMIVLLSSCGEEHTNVNYILENKSSADITLLLYKEGIVDSSSIVHLNTGESKIHYSESHRGKLKKPILFFSGIRSDSILIVLNNIYEVLQVLDTNLYQGTRRVVDTSSNRTLRRERNYDIVLRKKRRLSHYFDVIYTFTEEDYNFAKE